MTQTPDNTRWTGEKAAAFLKALASHGKVAPAARCVGMSRQAAYRLRSRAPKFAEFWEIAMRDAQNGKTRAKAASCRSRKQVHPLLAQNPVPEHAVTPPHSNSDTIARRRSHIAATRSHRGSIE